MGKSVHDGTPCYEQVAFLERRVAELEDERDIFARTLDKRDRQVAELKAAVEELTQALDGSERDLRTKRKAVYEWRQAAYEARTMLDDTQRECLQTLRRLSDNPLIKPQAE
jgi:chromosome segregation ATPase